MNIDDIKRNIRNKFLQTTEEVPLKPSKSEPAFRSFQSNLNDKYGDVNESDSEEEKEKPNSKVWRKPENSQSSFYTEEEPEEIPSGKRGRPRNKTNRKVQQSVDSFINENELENEVYNWKYKNKLGDRSRINMSEFMVSYFR